MAENMDLSPSRYKRHESSLSETTAGKPAG